MKRGRRITTLSFRFCRGSFVLLEARCTKSSHEVTEFVRPLGISNTLAPRPVLVVLGPALHGAHRLGHQPGLGDLVRAPAAVPAPLTLRREGHGRPMLSKPTFARETGMV